MNMREGTKIPGGKTGEWAHNGEYMNERGGADADASIDRYREKLGDNRSLRRVQPQSRNWRRRVLRHENLCSEHYPLLSQRPKRSFDRQLNSPQALISRDALCWIDNQQLYISGYSMAEYMTAVQITSGKKQIVSMGAYLCIFPDGIYFNTEKYSDNGYMGHANSVALGASRKLGISLCTVDGKAITVSYTQSDQPENATNGQYWMTRAGACTH